MARKNSVSERVDALVAAAEAAGQLTDQPGEAGDGPRKLVTSAANLPLGSLVQLRPEHGGGWWRVVEVLAKEHGLHRAMAVSDKTNA